MGPAPSPNFPAISGPLPRAPSRSSLRSPWKTVFEGYSALSRHHGEVPSATASGNIDEYIRKAQQHCRISLGGSSRAVGHGCVMVSVAPTTLPPHSLSPHSFEARLSLSPGACGNASSNPAGHMALRKRGKLEVCDAFLARLRERDSFDLDDFRFVEGVQQHFRDLPSRYALDVNIASLDVLNHKRLLDSARADPSALSFQVRPIDVISAAGAQADPSRRPSFSSSDAPLTEVRQHSLPLASRLSGFLSP